MNSTGSIRPNLSPENDFSFSDWLETGDASEDRCLSGTGWTEEHGYLGARIDLERCTNPEPGSETP
jgi:hypothetical protein